MILMIKNLNDKVTIEQLEKLVLPVAKGYFFQKAGYIMSIQLIDFVNRQGKAVDRHALLRVLPDYNIKQRIVKKLNGRLLQGESLVVSEYVARQNSAERRAQNDENAFSECRRVFQRRVPGLKMHVVSEKAY